MIRIILEDNLYCPVVFCDYCGKRIDRDADGNVEYRVGDKGEPNVEPVLFTHKECCLPFESSNGGRATWYTEELSQFMKQLAHNVKAK